MTGPLAAPLGALFQTAYVTNDLERAVAMFSERFSIPSFYIGEPHDLAQTDGTIARMRAALAWSGANQIEIIEQLGGDSGLYREFVPGPAFAVRHHHFCGRIANEADFDMAQQSLANQGFPIPVSVRYDGLYAFYADTREILGHYLEYVWLADDSMLTMGGKFPVYGASFLPRPASLGPGL